MGRPKISRPFVLRAGLALVAAGVMLAGSVALVRLGDNYAVGGQGKSNDPVGSSEVPRTLVTDIKNSPRLDPEAMLITVPLGMNFEVPGDLYGTKAKRPVHLGPKNVKGMTQDCFGSQAGMLLPDGRLLYHFAEQLAPFPSYAPGSAQVEDGTPMSLPTIRLYDPATGEDREVLRGARSMAWNRDGVLAYAKGVDAEYRLNVPYLQHVVVQQGIDGVPTIWTNEPADYTVNGWVLDALLVSKQVEGEALQLLALTGPGQSRQVASEAERLACVSPDGLRILVWSGTGSPEDPIVLRTVDWQTGVEVARVTLDVAADPASGQQLTAIGAGTWEGDTVVLACSPADLVLLSARDSELKVERVITFESPKLRSGTCSEVALASDGSRVFAVASEGTEAEELERTAVMTYDLGSGECTRWVVPGSAAITRLVGNSSRPR